MPSAQCLAHGKCSINIFVFLILPTGVNVTTGGEVLFPRLLPFPHSAALCPQAYSAHTGSPWGKGPRVAGSTSCQLAWGELKISPQNQLFQQVHFHLDCQVPRPCPRGVTFKFSAPPSSRPCLACSFRSFQTTPLPPSGPNSSGWLAWVLRLIQTSSSLFINSIPPYQLHHQEEGQEGLVTEVGEREALISLLAPRGHQQFNHPGFTWPRSRSGSRAVHTAFASVPAPCVQGRGPVPVSPLGRKACKL